MRAVVLAYHDMGCTGLEALLRSGIEVAAVFTHRDDPGENVYFGSVAALAASHGIPVYAPDDVNHPTWVARIASLEPDVLFSFFYRRLVRRPILEIPPQGCLNLHASLLPRYRGRCPVNWVLIHGEGETGVTLHYMTPRADDGDIVAQRRIPISDEDTARTLMAKCVDEARLLLDETLPRLLAGEAGRTPQDAARATTFGGRRPDDGEIDWARDAREVRNLVRAVTHPYPGAFSYSGTRKTLIWSATAREGGRDEPPGTVLRADPLVIACGRGALQVDFGQQEGGVYMSGSQLAAEMNLVSGMRLGPSTARLAELSRRKTVLILGVNGFIGSALSERILEDGGFDVHGMDLASSNIGHLLGRPGFHFAEGDIAIHREWIEYHVRKCDIVLPLVAIATPIEYTRNPLRVFELDFEENLRVIRYCVRYRKRVIFPSTSEVYGMSTDPEFDEDRSNLVLGPIAKQRWIYSCSKQLLDRVIWAYGAQEKLSFSLFRPFNWIGKRLDSLESARIGSSRAITQLILNLVEGSPILLIDGGEQKRCFTDVREGVECLYRIVRNEGGVCDGQIVNIGNPHGEASIRELAEMLVNRFEKHPLRSHFPPFAGFKVVESGRYYGVGYQDVQHRRPSIRNAKRLVGWEPVIPLEESVDLTLDYFLRDAVARRMGEAPHD